MDARLSCECDSELFISVRTDIDSGYRCSRTNPNEIEPMRSHVVVPSECLLDFKFVAVADLKRHLLVIGLLACF